MIQYTSSEFFVATHCFCCFFKHVFVKLVIRILYLHEFVKRFVECFPVTICAKRNGNCFPARYGFVFNQSCEVNVVSGFDLDNSFIQHHNADRDVFVFDFAQLINQLLHGDFFFFHFYLSFL